MGAKKTTVIVDDAIWEKWQEKYRKGDYVRIAAQKKTSSAAVSHAMRKREADPLLILKISEYYAAQATNEQLIKQAKEILNV